jgi:peptidoglycan/xylan/chitin deacetylase (PgdA/CDA1 family)
MPAVGDTLILCYHAVSESWPADLSLPPAEFERQIGRKLAAGYEGVTLTQSQAPDRPSRCLVVTFDDGYLSTLTVAAPILERLGVPATLFVPSDYIGRDEPMAWPGVDRWLQGPHRDELVPLSWEDVRTLAGSGWEIGSHTCSHPHLTTLEDDALSRELRDSRARIGVELGPDPGSIAYPYGDVDARVVAAARAAGYTLGAALPARLGPDADPMRLPRVGVYNGQGDLKLGIKTSRLVRRARRLARR